MNWTTIVIIVCVLLAALMLWQEYSRPNRSRLLFRFIAALVTAVALACIALPITYSSKSVTGIRDGVLLTSGFNEDSLSSYQNSKLFTTETAILKSHPKLKISLIDLAAIPERKSDIARLYVLGYGFNNDELKQLNHYPIQFHPPALHKGIIAINWNRHIKAGERLVIQGRFSGASDKTRLILKGLNTGLDSVVVSAKSKDQFKLQTTPKSIGRTTYTLLAINGKDTIERETIPFEVEPAKPLKVLILATSPDFENRFLKNWLSQHGYSVAVRTAISKEKFSREYFNMSQTDLDHVTATLLNKFDVLVGDLSSFKLLNSAESAAIQQQMAQKGLGVIVKADSTGKGASFLANAFAMDRLSDKNQKASSLNIEGQSLPSAKLTLDAVFIKPQTNTQTLVTDEQGRIMVNSTIYGNGKIVFSVLSNTFNWALSGNHNDYTALWSMLIDKASRKAVVNETWSVSPALPMVDEPVTITVDGPAALPAKVKVENNNIAFSQNPALPFSWGATYWPANYSWQQVTQNGIAAYWWYAYKAADWPTLHAAEKINNTKWYISQNTVAANTQGTAESNIKVPVSKFYFYLLLLFCCTYLWAERKM